MAVIFSHLEIGKFNFMKDCNTAVVFGDAFKKFVTAFTVPIQFLANKTLQEWHNAKFREWELQWTYNA
jgi:hypothetical protein